MSIKWKLLIVDDEAANRLLLKQLLQDSYDLSFAIDGQSAIEVAQKIEPDCILLDIIMPKLDGYETCRRLKSNPSTARIPVIFVSSLGEVGSEYLGFEVGGVDYITKPISEPLLLARVVTHISLYNQKKACEETVIQKTKELLEVQKAAVHMLGEAGHYNDTDTGIHTSRMSDYSTELARAINWDVDRVEMLALAATMHDTGKIGIPGTILTKPSKLTAEEWEIMKTHTTIGYSILSKSDTPLFKMAAEIACYHHERWNGTGYPKGLKGIEIPLSARIVAIADVFDALTMKRPYKEPWPVEKAFEEIERCSLSNFEPILAETFVHLRDKIIEIKTVWDSKY